MSRLSIIVTLPLTAAFVVFAIANREPVMVNFWPFGITLEMPLFMLALGLLALGALFGGLLMWIPLLRWRARARARERRVAELESRLDLARGSVDAETRETALGVNLVR